MGNTHWHVRSQKSEMSLRRNYQKLLENDVKLISVEHHKPSINKLERNIEKLLRGFSYMYTKL
jgi:hypothetical protein